MYKIKGRFISFFIYCSFLIKKDYNNNRCEVAMETKTIYRFEQNESNGCWYNKDGTFNNVYGKTCENVPMPFDNRPKEYRAGCFSLEDLFTWGSEENLKKMGARVIEITSNDYIVLPRGEVIYNETNILKMKIIKQY
jgi:hypothetical protein